MKKTHQRMRLPLLPPDQLNAQQRAFYDQLKADMKTFAVGQGFDTQGRFVGPFNPWLHQPELGKPIWAVNRAINNGSTLPASCQEIATLVVGCHFGATYEIESHILLARHIGVSDDAINAITEGRTHTGLSEKDGCAYEVAIALCKGGVVPDALYEAAQRLFGPSDARRLVYISGFYAMASMTMNFYDVPGPDPSNQGEL